MRLQVRMAFFGVLAASLCGCDNPNADVTAGKSGSTTVNGAVHVPAGTHVQSVGTVNGSIDVGDSAVVASVRAVNGSIEIGAHASAESISSVNGEVTLGEGARVSGGVTTVNGGVGLSSGADVGGAVKNVNGTIGLQGAHVAGGLRTVSGDINVAGSSRVEGGIVVQKSGGWFHFGSEDTRKPRIVIGPGAVVSGDLRFEREVQLYVSDKATVGPITGATPISFSGDKPPA